MRYHNAMYSTYLVYSTLVRCAILISKLAIPISRDRDLRILNLWIPNQTICDPAISGVDHRLQGDIYKEEATRGIGF